LPGIVSVMLGITYIALRHNDIRAELTASKGQAAGTDQAPARSQRSLLFRVSLIVFLTTAVSSIIFQSTTFALPKMFDERLSGLADDLVAITAGVTDGEGDVATVIGALAFVVFAVASMAQLVVGAMLDRFGPRPVFMAAAALQVVFFGMMPGLTDGLAMAAALGFMLGAFGQIPINDFMIGKMASGAARARIYGVRYVVSFSALAASLPLIAFVYERWGFDMLFIILAAAALLILTAVIMLPKRLPSAEAQPVAAE
ncbi:MAG: MFS transporter, partial [Pseudomonadota bacterium]